DGCPQHLSIYHGQVTVEGHGVTSRLVAWPDRDVFAVEIDDRRESPRPIEIRLRALRHLAPYAASLENLVKDHVTLVRTRNHTAASQLHIRKDRILLTQEFKEGTYTAKSAVAAMILGRAAQPQFANETEVRLIAPAASGKTIVL